MPPRRPDIRRSRNHERRRAGRETQHKDDRPEICDHLSPLRRDVGRDDAGRFLPMVLRMRHLQDRAETEGWGLLRVLFLWLSRLPVDSSWIVLLRVDHPSCMALARRHAKQVASMQKIGKAEGFEFRLHCGIEARIDAGRAAAIGLVPSVDGAEFGSELLWRRGLFKVVSPSQ